MLREQETHAAVDDIEIRRMELEAQRRMLEQVREQMVILLLFPRQFSATVKPHYNEVLRTMKITLLYQVSHYIRVKKQRNIKSLDQLNHLNCYKRVLLYNIRPLYNEVPLYYYMDGYFKLGIFVQHFH